MTATVSQSRLKITPARRLVAKPENATRKAYKTIGLLDHMGYSNMGDAAILESFITNIKSRLPHAKLVAFSLNPTDTNKRHGLESHPIRWCYPGWNGQDVGFGAATEASPGLKSFLKRCRPLRAIVRPVLICIREIRHLGRSYSLIKGLDLLVMSGGGQLCDFMNDLK
jgi:polysaccharide pyruvyl transferase WcaK-like protein